MTPITQRRIAQFKANRRGYYSLWIFMGLFVLSLFAEFIANDKPILMSHDDELWVPGCHDCVTGGKYAGGVFPYAPPEFAPTSSPTAMPTTPIPTPKPTTTGRPLVVMT